MYAEVEEHKRRNKVGRAIQKGMRLRRINGCSNLALSYYDGVGVEHDLRASLTLYQFSCSQGAARACTMVGLAHAQGLGVDIDLVNAHHSFEVACAGHDPEGCYRLGLHYQHGRIVHRNLSQAEALYERSCELSYHPACIQRAKNQFVNGRRNRFVRFGQL